MAKKLTAAKAKEMLHDKSVHGHPLTEQQRKYFGAVASGNNWLAKYGDEINPNDESVSLPEGFVGMGNNIQGRDYSPAWGGQFQNGGEMRYYQEGLDFQPKGMKDGGWLSKYAQDGDIIKKDNTSVQQPILKQMKTYSPEEGEEANRKAFQQSSKQALIETAKENVQKNFNEIGDSFLWNLPGSISPMAAEDLLFSGLSKGYKAIKTARAIKNAEKVIKNNPLKVGKIDLPSSTPDILSMNQKELDDYSRMYKAKEKKEIIGNYDANQYRGELQRQNPDEFNVANIIYGDATPESIAEVKRHANVFKEKFPEFYHPEFDRDRYQKDLGLFTKLSDPSYKLNSKTAFYEDINIPFSKKHDIDRNYTPEELKLIDAYTQGYDKNMNRRNRFISNYYEQDIIPKFEELIKKNKLKTPETFGRGDRDYDVANVWRGGEKIEGGLSYRDLQVGDEFEPRSFMSTSTLTDVDNPSFGDPLFQSYINAPAGQSFLFPNSSTVKNFEGEMEVILPEKLRYKVGEKTDYMKAFEEGFAKHPEGVIDIAGIAPNSYLKEGNQLYRTYSDNTRDLLDMQTENTNKLHTLLTALNPKILEKPLYKHNIVNPYTTVGAAALAGQAANSKNYRDGGVIKDDRGQWDHPGEITEIGSNQITMQGVPYPVLGISDTGDRQMMYPGQDYEYEGTKVTEYPMAKNGADVTTTNMTTKNPEKGNWLNRLIANNVTPYGTGLSSPSWEIDNKKLQEIWNAKYSGDINENMVKDSLKKYVTNIKTGKHLKADTSLKPFRPSNINASYDALNIHQGLPQKYNSFVESQYKPGNSNNPDSKYYELVGNARNEIINDLTTGQNRKFKDSKEQKLYVKNSIVGEASLKNFKYSKGKDDKGEYISYYDVNNYDNLLDKIGTPFEIYGRVYMDELNKKNKLENGGELQKLDQLTNFTNYGKGIKGGWLEKYSK